MKSLFTDRKGEFRIFQTVVKKGKSDATGLCSHDREHYHTFVNSLSRTTLLHVRKGEGNFVVCSLKMVMPKRINKRKQAKSRARSFCVQKNKGCLQVFQADMAPVQCCYLPLLPCAIFVFVLILPVFVPGTVIAPIAPIAVFVPFALVGAARFFWEHRHLLTFSQRHAVRDSWFWSVQVPRVILMTIVAHFSTVWTDHDCIIAR